jgi:hypothetical protein
MKAIEEKAAQVFKAAIEKLNQAGGLHIKFDHGRAYMPLVLERVGSARLAPDGEKLPLYSFAHYGELNGDLMRDPDVVMIDAGPAGLVPVSYRNDYAGVEWEHCDYSGPVAACVNAAGQADLAAFCSDWAENIHDQQNLGPAFCTA